MAITVDDMVSREVLCCVSALVSTLARGFGHASDLGDGDGEGLVEKAAYLVSPIPDYEEAATQEGWKFSPKHDSFYLPKKGYGVGYFDIDMGDWQALCAREGIEPIDREVFEHWAVSEWFAGKLEAAGEKVDRDFEGLNVWARTCTGQAIASDSVVIAIHAAMVAPYVDRAEG